MLTPLNWASIDLTTVGIVIAILTFWIQLHFQYAGTRIGSKHRVITVALAWLYIAILFGMFSFIGSLFDNSIIKRIGLALFLVSSSMGFINIVQTTLSVLGKMSRGYSHDEITGISEQQLKTTFEKMMVVVGLLFGASLIAVFISSWLSLVLWIGASIFGWISLKKGHLGFDFLKGQN